MLERAALKPSPESTSGAFGQITIRPLYDDAANANKTALRKYKLPLTQVLCEFIAQLAKEPDAAGGGEYDALSFNHDLDDPWAELAVEIVGKRTEVKPEWVLNEIGVAANKPNRRRLGKIMIALGWRATREKTSVGRRCYRRGRYARDPREREMLRKSAAAKARKAAAKLEDG